MIYLITKMIAYLVAVGLIGLALGWILRSLGVEKAKKLVEYSHQDKLAALSEQHQEELAEFAENAKQSRADLQRLEINNKALRDTITSNATALELAQAEVTQLSEKLESSDAFNKEILEVTGHSAEEFDKTMEVRDQALGDDSIELANSIMDNSLVSTQDKTMLETQGIGDHELEADTKNNMEAPKDTTENSKAEETSEEPVEITMGNLWSHIGKVVGTKK